MEIMELTDQDHIDLITLNAIRTLIKYTKDHNKIGGDGIDVQKGEFCYEIKIGLTYYPKGHPFNKLEKGARK